MAAGMVTDNAGVRSTVHSADGRWRLRAPGLLLVSAGSLACLTTGALGQIEGAAVARGSATFSQQGDRTIIRAADNTIINYSRFDIQRTQTVQFVQPGADARVLNRINSSSPTRIDGALLANGQVYLVNPAGVIFGRNAVIDASRFMAAGANIADSDFLARNDHFTNVTGPIVNGGLIDAQSVHLIGSTVENHGTIVADKGVVTMLSGNDVLLRESGSNISVKIDGQALNPAERGPGGGAAGTTSGGVRRFNSLGAGDVVSLAVHNTGTVRASGGSVTLGSGAGVVRNDGVVSASVASGAAGSVALQGDRVIQAGVVEANSNSGAGGDVTITSVQNTVLTTGSQTSAAGGSGAAEGGEVLVHAYQGSTLFAPGATIDISGGAGGGNGGFAEVSAKESLGFQGTVRARTMGGFGRARVQLDPRDVIISENGADNGQVSDGFINDPEDIESDYYVSASAIENVPGNVRIDATRDILIGQSINKVNGDLIMWAGRDIVLGAVSGPKGMPVTDLQVAANVLVMGAQRNIVDRALNGTRLVGNLSDVWLGAREGSIDFGSVSVPVSQSVHINQGQSLVLDPGVTPWVIENPATTQLYINIFEGGLTIGDAASPGTQIYEGIVANVRDSITIHDNLTLCIWGDFNAGEDVLVGGDVMAEYLVRFRSGQNGTGGDVRFTNPNLCIGGETIELIAGGPGIGGDARVDAITNAPSFFGPMCREGTSPSEFTFAQNPDVVASRDLPPASAFGGGLDCDVAYRVQSFAGDVVIDDGSRVAGSDLTLASASAIVSESDAASFITDDLNLCELTVEGRGVLEANVTTERTQEYQGAVIVRGVEDVVLTGTTVTFRSTLDGQLDSLGRSPALTVNADAFFEDSIGASVALGALVVNGATTLCAEDGSGATMLVNTLGDQRYNGATTLLCDVRLTSFGTPDGEGGRTAGTIRFGDTVNGAHDLTVFAQSGLIVFGGDVGGASPLRDILLCTDQLNELGFPSDQSRANGVPQRATIVGEGDLSIFTRDFAVCQGEKFTVLGDLNLNASRSATLGDVNTVGDMRVTSPDIVLLRRPASTLFRDATALVEDQGVDYVAGGGIFMNGTVSLGGDDSLPAPKFGSTANIFEGEGIQRFDRVQLLASETSLQAMVDDLMRILDQRVVVTTPPPPPPPTGGRSLADPRPRDPQFRDSVIPTVYDISLLRALAIEARGADRGESGGRGRLLYADLPADTTLTPEALAIAATRFDIHSVQRVVEQHDKVFRPAGVDRTEVLRAGLDTSACRFRVSRGAEAVDPRDLAAYLTMREEEAGTRQTLLDIRRLLDRVQALGLTPLEYVATRNRMLAPLAPEGGSMTLEELTALIEYMGTPEAVALS
jgi:filamentous hemagglutinin family protein